jgi:UDP-3-O-[3-hydroxymyristoyl] glucosamine N-acyltransferase
MTQIVMYGGGGRCRETIDILLGEGHLAKDMQIVDRQLKVDSWVYGVRVTGNRLTAKPKGLGVCCIGGLREMNTRAAAIANMMTLGYMLMPVVAPSADIASPIPVGAHVGRMAAIGVGCLVGVGVTINAGATVCHGSEIGRCAHIAPGATLCGDVRIGDLAIVGPGATICAGVTIGANALIAAGATVIHDVDPGAFVGGTPAVNLRRSTT